MSTIDTLPAYDDHRSPAYTETLDAQAGGGPPDLCWRAWAGAGRPRGVAVAPRHVDVRTQHRHERREPAESKVLLRWLRWANEHIANVIGALRAALDQYDGPWRTVVEVPCASDEEKQRSGGDSRGPSTEDRSEIAARISALKGDVLKTLARCDRDGVQVRRRSASRERQDPSAAALDEPARALPAGDDAGQGVAIAVVVPSPPSSGPPEAGAAEADRDNARGRAAGAGAGERGPGK